MNRFVCLKLIPGIISNHKGVEYRSIGFAVNDVDVIEDYLKETEFNAKSKIILKSGFSFYSQMTTDKLIKILNETQNSN